MRYPEFLRENGRLGFIAPSFGCGSLEPYHTRFLSALDYFEKQGFQTSIGPNVYLELGIGKSNTPEQCGEEINDYFCNEKCDVILSVGGGETMCEDLDFVDFERIAGSKPHWFMGYSDNTNLTFTLPTLCDIAAVYGPNASSFGMSPIHASLVDALALLKGQKMSFANYPAWEIEGMDSPENPTAPLNCTQPCSLALHMPAQQESPLPSNVQGAITMRGRLLGGCLDCLVCLCGTKYDKVRAFNQTYQKDGVLWFLESCDLNPISILRSLWQLKNAGWFDNARGFLIGRPLHYTETMMSLNCHQAFLQALGELHLPILLDVDFGHLPPQLPLISGAVGTVVTDGKQMQITYDLSN